MTKVAPRYGLSGHTTVTLDELSGALADIVAEYTEETNTRMKACCKKNAKNMRDYTKNEAKSKIGQNRTSKKGKPNGYISKISYKKQSEGVDNVSYVVYAKAPEYRLTHLLEFGHVIWNAGNSTYNKGSGTYTNSTPKTSGGAGTGRSPALPHWAPADERMEREFLKEAERILRG